MAYKTINKQKGEGTTGRKKCLYVFKFFVTAFLRRNKLPISASGDAMAGSIVGLWKICCFGAWMLVFVKRVLVGWLLGIFGQGEPTVGFFV